MLENQPSSVPTRKVTSVAIAGTFVAIAALVFPELEFNAALQSAVTTIVAFVAAYFTREEA